MEKYITIKQSDFEAILGYIDTVMEFTHPNGKNIAKVNNGYEAYVKPFRDADKLQTPEAYMRNQEIETFAENLQDLYGVDTSAISRTLLEELYDKFNEEFSGEIGEIESNIITRLVNTNPLPALVGEDEEVKSQFDTFLDETLNFVNEMLSYSDKNTKVFASAAEEESKKTEASKHILDFTTQTIENLFEKQECVLPVCFYIEHTGYKPKEATLPKPDFQTTKKANMSYWNGIDDCAEKYVRKLVAISNALVVTDDAMADEEVEEFSDNLFLDISKEVVDFTVDLLSEGFEAVYPYVDEEY